MYTFVRVVRACMRVCDSVLGGVPHHHAREIAHKQIPKLVVNLVFLEQLISQRSKARRPPSSSVWCSLQHAVGQSAGRGSAPPEHSNPRAGNPGAGYRQNSVDAVRGSTAATEFTP